MVDVEHDRARTSDPSTVRRPRIDRDLVAIAAIGVMALVGRVVYVLAVTRNGDLWFEGDAFSYHAVAGNLADGVWFVDPFGGGPIADHPPMTVLLLAPVDAIFGSVTAQRLTMAVIGALAVVVIGLVGRRVGGPLAGIAAAAVAAINPNLWINDGLLMSESLSALVIAVLLLAGFWLKESPGPGRTLVLGVLCGLATLTRAELALFVPFMVIPIVWRFGEPTARTRLGSIGLAIVASLVVIAPWSAWNSTRFAEPVAISTNDGTVLAGANCPDTYRGPNLGGWSLDCVADVPVDGLDPAQAATVQRDAGIDHATDQVGRLPLVILAREARSVGLWQPGEMAEDLEYEGRRPVSTWLAFGAFWLLVPVSVLGAVHLRRRGVTLIPFGACLAMSLLVVAATHGTPRLHLPLDVAMSVLAGVGVTTWIAPRRRACRTDGADRGTTIGGL